MMRKDIRPGMIFMLKNNETELWFVLGVNHEITNSDWITLTYLKIREKCPSDIMIDRYCGVAHDISWKDHEVLYVP